ncbi:MAG TPA: MmgE/PrpD family protein [Candidatus Acidoferrales bacterium]|nr:MmgE/PrpD family protein [Candidatus Acidoferrales bacterium]
MIRREFFRNSLLAAAAALTGSQRWESSASGRAMGDFPAVSGLTKYVSEFIVNTKYEDIPETVIALGKKTLLDGFGLALAGSASASGVLIRRYIETLGFSDGKASIMGTGVKAPARFAALANGISIHADDYDDTGSALHVTAPMLPAAFAHCELERRSGKDLMLAFHVGVEVASKIGDAISPRHNGDGFHTTGTCGSFGSAAACAKLRGLSAKQTAYALGVAGSEASGLRDNFGSMTKPFHAGHAAENGIVAADLAALGWTASDDILEAPLGFFQAAGGTFDPSAIVDRLGKPWMFASPGDLIKRFPCGTIQQAFMDQMLRLIRENNITAKDVDRVEVGGNRSNLTTLFRHHPTTGLEAKFSMEFAMSVLLLEGKAGLSQFTDAVVQRPDVQDMIRRVSFYVDPEFDKQASQGGNFQAVLVEGGILKVHLKDGRTFSGRTQPAKGSPENPMTYDEVADKFRGNTEFSKWPRSKAQSIIELVKSLENLSDVNRITAAVTS